MFVNETLFIINSILVILIAETSWQLVNIYIVVELQNYYNE